MTLKSFLFILISIFISGMATAVPYNRQNCDKTIGVEKYIHAGSLGDESVGGKTYNFTRIVSALENEVLGGKEPRVKNFRCLDDLFEKAKEDATTYWANRIGNSTCVGDNGRPPATKPDSCDQSLWDEFHNSMAHITRAEQRKKAIPASCKLQDGKNRCEPNSELQALAAATQPLAGSQSDNCCNKEYGPAFRVLKTFYTVDLGKLSNDELQRECYKRTQPNQEYGAFGFGAITGCLANIVKGILESAKKILSSAAALIDVGLWSEILRVLGKAITSSEGRAELAGKIGNFLEEVGKQVFSQAYSTTACFTGAYKTQQVCRLVSGLITDYIAGGGMVKLLGYLAKAVSKSGPGMMAKAAADWVKETPSAQKIQSQLTKISEGAKNVKVQAQVGTKASVASTKSLAVQLASKMNPTTAIKDSVANMVKKMRDKLKGNNEVAPVEIGSNLRGPNATTVVDVQSAPVAPKKLSPAIAASKTRVTKVVNKYKPGKTPPENVFGNLGFGKTKPNKTVRANKIKEKAQEARADVDTLRKAGHYSDKQASDALKAIDDMEGALQAKLGTKPAATVAPTTAAEKPPVASNAPDTTPSSTNTGVKSEGDIKPSTPDSPPGTLAAGSVSPDAPSATAPIRFPDLDMGSALKSGATPTGSTATRWSGLTDFVKKAQEQATKPTPNMQSVYGQKGFWGVTRDSIKRHADVEEMYRKGFVNENTAMSLHQIIASTEQMAKNAARASTYSTKYIKTPNTALTTGYKVAQVAKPTAVVTSRTMAGQYMSGRQYQNASDPRYDNDTLNQAIIEIDNSLTDEDSIPKKFGGLQSAGAINNQATRMIAQAKVLEAYFAKFGDDAQKADVAAFIARINQERDRALQRLVKEGTAERDAETAEVPAEPAAAEPTP